MTLKRLTTGVYRSKYSIRAVVNTSVGRKEKRFPPDTPIPDIKRWRNEIKGKFAAMARRRPKPPAARRGTLRADIERYIKTLTIVSWKTRRSELKAWAALYGDLPRYRITGEMVQRAVKLWMTPEGGRLVGRGQDAVRKPYQTWSIRHRIEALRALYKALDGKDAITPVDSVSFEKPVDGNPVFVSPKTIMDVAAVLAQRATSPHRARRKQTDNVAEAWKTRARFLVLATTGARPVELMRALEGDVDLTVRIWAIRTAKGGIARVLRLNTPEMLMAWKVFIKAEAWGEYDTSRHAKRVRLAGWPDGIRPYALRGTWGMELSRRGADLADIQHLMGHSDIETTRLFYVPAENSRLAAATKATSGRIKIRA